MKRKTEDQIFRERQAREGAKGGKKTKERYGSTFFSDIAKEGWKKRRKKSGDKSLA